MKQIVTLSLIALLSVLGTEVKADEAMTPLVESGDWIALAHQSSMMAQPDMCGATEIRGKLLFRADANGIQIRSMNNSWSLPPHVTGSVALAVGTFKKKFDINYNTSDVIGADISKDDVIGLLEQMDNNSSIFVAVGKAPPVEVSLAGSTKATNAFRTCAGLQSNAKLPGSNPFD